MIPNNKITLTDTFIDIVMKMSNGNPGAITVISQLFKEESKIDPDSALAPFGTILSLDAMGIYADKIWILYKNVCSSNIIRLVALIRANQLGFISNETIEDAIKPENVLKPNSIDTIYLLQKVQKQLPNFAKELLN
jgi:hypothetical protein